MVGIVILNYNNITDTCKCIDTVILYSNKDEYKLCIVDNCSRKEVKNAIGNHLKKYRSLGVNIFNEENIITNNRKKITYILAKSNTGYANGNNIGLKYFENDLSIKYYMILNSDVVFTMNIISPLVTFLKQHPEVGVVSPLLYDKRGYVDYECARLEKNKLDILAKITKVGKIKFIKERLLKNKILYNNKKLLQEKFINIELPSGSCMLLPKNIMTKIGFFDSHTFLYYEEDLLWLKLKNLRLKSILIPDISCIHLGAGTISKSPSKFIQNCYRNSMLYYLSQDKKFSKIFITLIKIKIKLSSYFK